MHNFSRPLFNPKQVNLIDITLALKNSGYETSISDFDFAVENKAYVYRGCTPTNKHQYSIAFFDDNTGEGYYVADIFLFMNDHGLMCADYGGQALDENVTEQQVLEQIENLRKGESTCSQ